MYSSPRLCDATRFSSRHRLHPKDIVVEKHGYIHDCSEFYNIDEEAKWMWRGDRDEQCGNRQLIQEADDKKLPYTQVVFQWKAMKEPLYAWGNLERQDTLKQAVFDPKDLVLYSVLFIQGLPHRRADMTNMAGGASDFLLDLNCKKRTSSGFADPYDMFKMVSPWQDIRLF